MATLYHIGKNFSDASDFKILDNSEVTYNGSINVAITL